jgi:rhamnosyl/mannosyltransferase
MRRLRVLQVGKYYPPERGGIERVVATLCEGKGEGAGVVSAALVCGKGRATTLESRNGVAVRRVGSLAAVGAVTIAPTLPFWLARTAADVVVVHEPNPMALVAYALARPAGARVVWFHSEVIRPRWQYRLFYEPLLRFVCGRASRIVVSSPRLLEAPALEPYRDRCRVVPLGIPVDRYVLAPAAAAEVERRRRDARRPVVLFVGRLVGYKGVDVLLRAFEGLDAELVVVGDGPRRAALEAQARERGRADRVRFVGEVSDDELLAWYHVCDVLALPSITRQETFGMVQVEAMLCGRPVVSTDVGTGVAWVNQHERTGLVVPPGDVAALHAALVRLTGDRGLRHRFGARARARVLEHFTADRMCREAVALYREVTGLHERTAVETPAPVDAVETT